MNRPYYRDVEMIKLTASLALQGGEEVIADNIIRELYGKTGFTGMQQKAVKSDKELSCLLIV